MVNFYNVSYDWAKSNHFTPFYFYTKVLLFFTLRNLTLSAFHNFPILGYVSQADPIIPWNNMYKQKEDT